MTFSDLMCFCVKEENVTLNCLCLLNQCRYQGADFLELSKKDQVYWLVKTNFDWRYPLTVKNCKPTLIRVREIIECSQEPRLRIYFLPLTSFQTSLLNFFLEIICILIMKIDPSKPVHFQKIVVMNKSWFTAVVFRGNI